MHEQSLEFLEALIEAPSPSGFEGPVARLYRSHVEKHADKVTTDVLGNVTAILNPDAPLRVMYAGHMDEIGFIVHHIDENGFLFFNTIGGTDVATEIGQRVWVLGQEKVAGVIGRKAIQTFGPSDSSKTPMLKDLWIDIGAVSRDEALSVVKVGNAVVLQDEFVPLLGDRAIGRGFDNKAGLFIGAEVVKELGTNGGLHPDIGLYTLGTVQEEIGSRGAQTATFNIQPHIALAVDMGVAMDYPRARPEEQGELMLGKGPAISEGPNTNPIVFELLKQAAAEKSIPVQFQAYGDKSPTDARVIQTSRSGTATAVLSVPLRYMHTPSEVISLNDVQASIDLVCAFCRRLTPDVQLLPW